MQLYSSLETAAWHYWQNVRLCIHNQSVVVQINYHLQYGFGQLERVGQEGYLGCVSGRKTAMAQEVRRRAQMMKEE